ncbi:MAG: diacylglycerol kinase family protein [bacterium]|nr:diacylglycerol kinase family protein [bacterium]
MVMKFVKSVTHAIEGLWCVLKEHANFRIHILLAAVTIVLGVTLRLSNLELSILVITITLVLMAEILNTAVEELSDLITVRWSKHAKAAKDVSAGMVLIASICAVIVGWLLFIPKLN